MLVSGAHLPSLSHALKRHTQTHAHKHQAQDFGEHGREFISSEVGLRLLELLGDADALSKLVGGGRRAARLQAILQHTAFKVGVSVWCGLLLLLRGAGSSLPQRHTCQHQYSNNQQILPMENTAGRDLVEGGKLCERKNGRGVDPNRNWDIDWGVKEKDYDPNEEFPGKAPLRCVFASPGVWVWLWGSAGDVSGRGSTQHDLTFHTAITPHSTPPLPQ